MIPANDCPKIAVVVSAYDEADTISHLLKSCLDSTYPVDRIRIFVGDDGSSDSTVEQVRQFEDPRISLRAYTDRRGKISVLNSLMSDEELLAFEAPIVLFCDAKSKLSPNLLRDVSIYFEDPKVGCVACKLDMESTDGKSKGEGLYWRYEMHLKSMEDALGSVMGCNGGGFAMRTELYQPIPAGTIVEDFVISIQALIRGYTIRFCKTAVVSQPACADVRAEWVRKVRIGAGNFQAIRPCAPLLNPLRGMPSLIFWGHKMLRWFAPFLLMAAWLSDVVALCLHPRLNPTLHIADLVVGAFLLVSARLCWLAPKKSWPAPIRLAGYFALMNVALVAGFVRWILRTQKVTWERADRGWTAPAQGGA